MDALITLIAALLITLILYVLLVFPLHALILATQNKQYTQQTKIYWIVLILIFGPLAAIPYFAIHGTKSWHKGVALTASALILTTALFAGAAQFLISPETKEALINTLKTQSNFNPSRIYFE